MLVCTALVSGVPRPEVSDKEWPQHENVWGGDTGKKLKKSSWLPQQQLVCRNILTMSCFSRSGMQSIQGKTCLSQTKGWCGNWTVSSLTCLPSQSLSSTHRLDLTASTNAQSTSSTHAPPSQHFLNAKKPHHSRSSPIPPRSPFATVGNWSGGLLDWCDCKTNLWCLLPGAVTTDRKTEVQVCCSSRRSFFRDCNKYYQRACTTTVCCVHVLL